ncbi:hypothetical protein FOA52_002732 [Chlamydomonas sp. UWO 241]|nr:hypothetical protein FOA52_002732 [Chlamydomonas sp. UWO 241]
MCRSGSSQAAEVLGAIQAARTKYYVAPRSEALGWRDLLEPSSRGAAAAAEQHSRPDSLPSITYQLVWYRRANGPPAAGGGSSSSSASSSSRPGPMSLGYSSGAVSVWRPVGPPGYAALGDVAVGGTEPPPMPVRMYKDDGGRSMVGGEAPRLAKPIGYSLQFRDSAGPQVVMWRPLPPPGYLEAGCVAWPDAEEPPLGLVRCIRRDLVERAPLARAPLWAGASSDNRFWRCWVWPVGNAAHTFMVAKSDGGLNPDNGRAPTY